jgi:hypothetical protein
MQPGGEKGVQRSRGARGDKETREWEDGVLRSRGDEEDNGEEGRKEKVTPEDKLSRRR